MPRPTGRPRRLFGKPRSPPRRHPSNDLSQFIDRRANRPYRPGGLLAIAGDLGLVIPMPRQTTLAIATPSFRRLESSCVGQRAGVKWIVDWDFAFFDLETIKGSSMGISRLRWGMTLIAGGLFLSLLGLLPRPANSSLYEWQDYLFGVGLGTIASYIGGIAFLIQHYRHRHDYDDEDADRRE
jgi:hypothetical protein